MEILLNNLDRQYDIICVTEHWLKEEELDMYHLNNYNIVSNFCRKDYLHGGVLIIAHKKHETEDITPTIGPSKEIDFEVCGVRVTSTNMVILSIYRSPRGDINIFLQKMELTLNKIYSMHNCKIILMGDFNINFMEVSRSRTLFTQLMSSYNITAVFEAPSRTVKNTRTCPDNVLTNNSSRILSRRTFNPHISDHLAQELEWDIDVEIHLQYPQASRRMTPRSVARLVEMLSATDWTDCENEEQPEICFEEFNRKLLGMLEDTMPFTNRKVQQNRLKINWYTEELRQMRNSLDALFTVAASTRDATANTAYTIYREMYKNKIVQTKKEKISNYIQGMDNKKRAVWQIINQEHQPKKREYQQSVLTATDFNNYFVQVGINGRGRPNEKVALTMLKRKGVDNRNSFYMADINESDVMNIVRTMKIKTSTDCYGMSTKLLKEIMPYIVAPLVPILNSCLRAGVFPKSMKLAEVIPIYKKGDRHDPSNYRPISMLPVLSKILEYWVRSQLVSYINKKNIIGRKQHGFLNNKSTVTAMIQSLDRITEAFEEGKVVEVAYCDLSKAFDSIAHNILLSKLEHYGIRGIPLQLLSSYLQGRKQRVRFEGQLSEWREAVCGIPQGSVLGPLLFLLYIEDLAVNVMSDDICLFADDTSFLNGSGCTEEVRSKTRRALAEADDWFTANSMKLNAEKTKIITYTTNHHETQSAKFLGVWFQSDLRWDFHISEVCKKLTKATFLIRRLIQISTKESAITAYYATFQSHLQYAILVWGASPRVADILLLQKRTIRLLCNASARVSCRELFKQQRILTVTSLYILACLEYIHKHIDEFKRNNDQHDYGTRFGNGLQIPYHRISRSRNGANYWCIKFYNKLPKDIWKLPGPRFRQAMKNMLLEQTLYTIQEFLEAELSVGIEVC